MGIIILAAVLLILGFLLAWISGMVAKDEVDVKTGVITLVCAGVLSFLAKVGLNTALEESGVQSLVYIAIDFVILAACLRAIAKLEWKHTFIIAAIYDAILFGVGLALS
jgi:hypothetical protein